MIESLASNGTELTSSKTEFGKGFNPDSPAEISTKGTDVHAPFPGENKEPKIEPHFNPDERVDIQERFPHQDLSEYSSNGADIIQHEPSVESGFPKPPPFMREASVSNNLNSDVAVNPDSRAEVPKNENIEKKGGCYGELRAEGHGWNHEPPEEVHHMPSCESSPLERNDGPAIAMDYEDHRETASCGNSREAQEYRAEQARLIKEGKFEEAMQMDIDDIHDKFGDKYDEGIQQMKDYVETLKEEGRV